MRDVLILGVVDNLLIDTYFDYLLVNHMGELRVDVARELKAL